MTRAIKVANKVFDDTEDVISAASKLSKKLDMSSGVYEITYESGKRYVGKGNFNRAITSAKRYSNSHKLNNYKGDKVTSIR